MVDQITGVYDANVCDGIIEAYTELEAEARDERV